MSDDSSARFGESRGSREAVLAQTISAVTGPCLDCIHSGALVASDDFAADRGRWPAFVDAALMVGYRTVVAVPLRLRDHTIGGLNLFEAAAEPMTAERRHLAQALADLTMIALLGEIAAAVIRGALDPLAPDAAGP